MQETAAASPAGARLLRDSFAGINARFHLVGTYALLGLLLKISETMDLDAPELAGLVLAVLVVFYGTVCGICGLVYHAAAGRPGPPSFGLYASALFLPLFWLTFKIAVIVLGLSGCVAAIYHLASGSGATIEQTAMTVSLWGEPIIGLLTRLLWLYSIPACMQARLRGEWRPHVQAGLRLMRAFPSESRRLALPLVAIAALDAALLLAREPGAVPQGPEVTDALVLLVQYYLELVVLFGATRIVVERASRDERRAPGEVPRDPAAGPPA
jgi:hypothetical protein